MTVIMVVVVRQFSFLSSLEEDQKRLLVVDRSGRITLKCCWIELCQKHNLKAICPHKVLSVS